LIIRKQYREKDVEEGLRKWGRKAKTRARKRLVTFKLASPRTTFSRKSMFLFVSILFI